jgi:hypothetical protein
MVYEKISAGAKLLINRYHIHHSVAGLGLMSLSIFLQTLGFDAMSMLFVFGLGLGNVVQHTREEGLIFLEKEFPCEEISQEELPNGGGVNLPYGMGSIHIVVSKAAGIAEECQPAEEPTEG